MRDAPETIDFPSWLDTKLAERDWEVSDLARHAGISASIIHRWRKTYRPNVVNCRAVAQAFGLPVLEVLIVAGIITPDEARTDVALPPSITTVPTAELTRELHRRAEQAETAERSKPDDGKMFEHLRKLIEERDNVRLKFDGVAVEGQDGQRYRLVQVDNE